MNWGRGWVLGLGAWGWMGWAFWPQRRRRWNQRLISRPVRERAAVAAMMASQTQRGASVQSSAALMSIG